MLTDEQADASSPLLQFDTHWRGSLLQHGRSWVAALFNGTLYLVNLDTGDNKKIAMDDALPAISPSGRKIAYVENGAIWIRQAWAKSQPVRIGRTSLVFTAVTWPDERHIMLTGYPETEQRRLSILAYKQVDKLELSWQKTVRIDEAQPYQNRGMLGNKGIILGLGPHNSFEHKDTLNIFSYEKRLFEKLPLGVAVNSLLFLGPSK